MVDQAKKQNKNNKVNGVHAAVVGGIDPGLRHPAVCVARSGASGFEFELVSVQPKLRGAARLDYIAQAVLAPLRAAGVRFVAIEGYSYHSIGRLCQLGEVGGVLRRDLWGAGIQYAELSPAELKKFVSGKGSASKETMIHSVLQHYGVDTEDDDDLADAVGLAVFARVLLSGNSSRRCELEVVKRFSDRRRAS